MELIYILDSAIASIQNLESYYLSQIDVVMKRVKENGEKYKYGVVLEKFFFSKAIEDDEFQISEYEKKLLDEILEEYHIEQSDTGLTVQYKLKNPGLIEKKYELNPHRAIAEFRKLSEQPEILNDSTIMMILVRYEEAIAELFRYLIGKYPAAYLNDKSITYAELIKLDTEIKNIRKIFLDKEVDEIMRQPISYWYSLFEGKHKVKFCFPNDEFESFKEIYYRRNLVVHNQGVVNDNYIANIKTEMIVGDKARIDKSYLKNAFEITQIVIYGTIIGLGKLSSNVSAILNRLFDLGFQHMLDDEWRISEYIFGNLLKHKGQDNAELLCNKINYWISIKNQGRFEEIQKEIEEFDVSAHSGRFKAAKYALLDKFDKVTEILEEIMGQELQASHVESWPLFKQYRESEEYSTFRQRHNELFEVKGYEPEYVKADEEDLLVGECDGTAKIV